MVSKFKTDDGAITVTGPSFDYESGQRYVLSGTYVDHPRYGFQFSMLSVEKYISTRKEEILSLLKSSAFPGIGKKAAEKIYEHFGADIRAMVDADTNYKVNPTGKFVIGGPHGDTGLTGRKIIVDTYGGRGAHGGGAFSGKDPSKVDRSAAYACRHIAKNVVAAGIADEVLVQVAYAIGVAEPVSFYINTYGTSHVNKSDVEIAAILKDLFDMRPAAIIRDLKLLNPIYTEAAAYGHMGRKYELKVKKFESLYNETKEVEVELFTWEKLNRTEALRAAFGLS